MISEQGSGSRRGWTPHRSRERQRLSFGSIFARVSWTDRPLFAALQVGLVNNLNDGMSCGILPLFFAAYGLGIEQMGVHKAVYPLV